MKVLQLINILKDVPQDFEVKLQTSWLKGKKDFIIEGLDDIGYSEKVVLLGIQDEDSTGDILDEDFNSKYKIGTRFITSEGYLAKIINIHPLLKNAYVAEVDEKEKGIFQMFYPTDKELDKLEILK